MDNNKCVHGVSLRPSDEYRNMAPFILGSTLHAAASCEYENVSNLQKWKMEVEIYETRPTVVCRSAAQTIDHESLN